MDMAQGRLLSIHQICDKCTSSRNFRSIVVDAEAGQGGRAKLFAKCFQSPIGKKVPTWPGCDQNGDLTLEVPDPGIVRLSFTDDQFRRGQP